MTDEQRKALFDRQMKLLHTFLEHGMITKAQFLKNSTDLNAKMFPETRAKSPRRRRAIGAVRQGRREIILRQNVKLA